MKRLIAILLSVLALSGVLTACGRTVSYDDGRSYGNVSDTPNGRVNGGTTYRNDNYSNGGNIFDDMENAIEDDFRGENDRYGAKNSRTPNRNGSNRTESGTGMTGGR